MTTDPQRPGRRMADAAQAFLDTLDAPARAAATAPFDTPDRRVWTYLPGPRAGLCLTDTDDRSYAAAMDLLEAGCGAVGAAAARAAIELERIRRELVGGRPVRAGDDRYWIRVLGTPGREPWAWRINGHHLAVHLTAAAGGVAATPAFLGAEPAEDMRVVDAIYRAAGLPLRAAAGPGVP